MEIPDYIYSGLWKEGHVQGIAVDKKIENIYYSFTNILVKTTIDGKILGSVTGIYGHLGCIAYNNKNNKVYASLEFKNDAIGEAIRRRLNVDEKPEEGFYVAIFDVEKINRLNMDAYGDGVMTTVYLKTVTDDYCTEVENINRKIKHRYGCSGIDGISFGPDFGEIHGKHYLCVAYGIYGDISRQDNDYQVIVQYDCDDWTQYESSLRLSKIGPVEPRNKYFVYTGNTTYGIQNLEYDPFTNKWLAAVYRGSKPQFQNRSLYTINGLIKPRLEILKGSNGERGLVLTLSEEGLFDKATGIYGWESKYGTTGLVSLGDGRFYISHEGSKENAFYSEVYMYKWTGQSPCPFQRAE
ncbi:hypothetical protein SDC9_117891 [bioreactor metagenome]|uniref:Uncharacterized protein n=1 Tax=bioreactor metagenome TaxID=1076179 RepID=A0A645BZI6_9ZZZZ|nr:hypothetical protein [Oscillospiraceae bacterium]